MGCAASAISISGSRQQVRAKLVGRTDRLESQSKGEGVLSPFARTAHPRFTFAVPSIKLLANNNKPIMGMTRERFNDVMLTTRYGLHHTGKCMESAAIKYSIPSKRAQEQDSALRN
jgi:hypothetical protein